MASLAHLSDLHFGRVDSEVVKALREDINRARPDVTVISGDLTQTARRREFRRAQAFLKAIETPQVVVPGNHDIPNFTLERFFAPLRKFRRTIEADAFPTFESEELSVLGVNSARSFGWYWDWSRGRLNRKQIRRAKDFFTSRPVMRLRILVSHHPFLRPPESPQARLIGRYEMALETLADGSVDVVLGGHLHQAYAGEIETVPSDDRNSALLVVQASTATSTRTREEPNAYNWIEGDRSRIQIENRAWNGKAFETAARHIFHRTTEGWEPQPG